jgi:Oxidoreductase FAD-binding domain
VNGELVVRAYSPVSSDDDVGYFELVIKVRHSPCTLHSNNNLTVCRIGTPLQVKQAAVAGQTEQQGSGTRERD